MTKSIVLAIFVLSLVSLLFCGTAGAIFAVNSGQAPNQTVEPNASSTRSVVNTFVSKIDGGVLYTKTGQTYTISGINVICNCGSETNATTAQLYFINGVLKQVILQ
ncbi:MAG: hypothetical protein ACP5IL_03435 [Syntrophobacteraceae bacterium]